MDKTIKELESESELLNINFIRVKKILDEIETKKAEVDKKLLFARLLRKVKNNKPYQYKKED